MYTRLAPISKNRKHQRGIVLFLLLASLLIMMVIAAYAIDRSFLYYRRVQAEQAADFSALAAGWYISTQLANGTTTLSSAQISAAQTAGDTIASENGYATTTVTITPNYKGNVDWVSVSILRAEPMFFSGIVGERAAEVGATATVDCTPYGEIGAPPTWYGRVDAPFCLCAYGPYGGAVRGDAIDAIYQDPTASPLVNNPYYNPLGEVYSFTVPADYELRNANLPNGKFDGKVDFEIYDPEMYGNSAVTAGNLDQDAGASPGETWNYSLWKGYPHAGGSTEIAWANYNEGSDSLASSEHNTWVQPPGFSYNPTTDLSAGQPVNYYIEVSSVAATTSSNGIGADPNISTTDLPGSGTGTEKNGYLLRAGPDHPELNPTQLSNGEYVTNPATTYTYSSTNYPNLVKYNGDNGDLIWENEYGYSPGNSQISDPSSFSGAGGVMPIPASTASYNYTNPAYTNPTTGLTEMQNGVQMLVDTSTGMSITCTGAQQSTYSLYLIPIYFGYAPANANASQAKVITFSGFDEDTGANNARPPFYECSTLPGQQWIGAMPTLSPFGGSSDGNGIWDDYYPADTTANTVTLAAGTYTSANAGLWTAYYTTGMNDVVTWKWNGNPGGPRAWLTSTSYTTLY